MRPEDFSADLRVGPARDRRTGTLRQQVETAQRGIVLDALRRHEWNKTRAARSLAVTRQGLIKMMHRLELPLTAPEAFG